MSIEDEDKLETFFVLLKDQVGVVLSKSIFSVGAVVNAVRGKRSNNTFRALRGSLYKLVPDDENHNYSVNLVSVDNPHNYLQKCDLNDVRKLSKEEYDILLAVPTGHQRCDVIMQHPDGRSQLKHACDAKLGDIVEVDNDSEKCVETKIGILTYIGVVGDDKAKKGVHFGVRLNKAVGESSDNYLGESIFVPVHKINFILEDKLGTNEKQNDQDIAVESNQKLNKANKKSGGENVDKTIKLRGKQTVPTQNTKKRKNKSKQKEGIDLTVGTRVVCFVSDDPTPIAGSIRYLDNIGDEGTMAGVELDIKHPETNFGHYRGTKKIFDCELGKGLIVKPSNLIKEVEYLNKEKQGIDLPVGTRVVCFLTDDPKPVAGTIRYFDNIGNEGIMAGVELDIKHPKIKLGHYYHGKTRIFDCDYGKGLIVKPDMLMKEEEYAGDNNGKQTYVTVNDGSSKKLGLETKEVKPTEVKSMDPYEEQKELFKKLEGKKHASLLNIGQTQKYPTQNYVGREEDIELAIRSHDQVIQGIKNDIDTKLPSSEFVSNRQDLHINAGAKSNYSEAANTILAKQNTGEKREDWNISNISDSQSSLQTGSMVEIMIQFKKYYGVLRWRGVDDRYPDTIFAGIELENNELNGCTDGTFLGRKHFHSPTKRAFFVKLHQCKPDSRFVIQDTMVTQKQIATNINTSIKGSIMPITKLDMGYLGRDKGIQGNFNSCYMDSILFAMFGYSHAFDVILNRKKRFDDIKEYDTVQNILKEKIVNPLRKNGFVAHPSILELRKCLNELGDIGGFMTEEKDPEEFIVLLFEKVLNVDPFIKFRVNNREEVSHLYQIFFPKEERNPLPSVQYLLEYSFLTSNLKLAEIPSVMILQMPRFGQQKLYKRIQITSTIDVTPLLADEMHACVICGQCSSCYCPDCACLLGWEVVHTYLCESCWNSVHSHPKRHNHKQTPVNKSPNSIQMSTSNPVLLELFAVVCIEKSHYVSFVKCGSDEDETWLFFDSMADRIGGESGHNIPEVTLLDNLKKFLNGNPLEISELDKKSNEQVLRVFDDASLCLYCNKKLTMYR